MTKKKSKQIKQLKYLLLIPVLASMLFYTACSQETSSTAPEQKKENTVMYMDIKEMKKHVSETKKTYMDVYLGIESPKTKELQVKDLTSVELIEFNKKKEEFQKFGKDIPLRLFEGIDVKERRIIYLDLEKTMKMFKYERQSNKEGGNHNVDNVPFSMLDKHPTFPGCIDGDKECFNQSMAKFVKDNFDFSRTANLDLERGKKRIYVQFKIDKNGEVVDVKARAPRPELKQYAIEVVKKLPKMKPGMKDKKNVTTGYTLPITFEVK